jgi:hypothetical protein
MADDLAIVEATDEDRARWREEFRPKLIWIPQLHYHEQSESYVEGLRPFDGCWICDNQWPLVEEAMRRGEPVPAVLCVVVPDRALAWVKKRIGIYGEFFFNEPDLDEKVPGLSLDARLDGLSLPNRDDVARWRKQFGPVLSWLKPVKDTKLVSKHDIEDMVPDGPAQVGVFGGAEIIPFKKVRRKRK